MAQNGFKLTQGPKQDGKGRIVIQISDSRAPGFSYHRRLS